ncbi:MAG: PAS domain-containing sensor histidine kinase [Moraxellaceae bacterium]|nr:PAS domain-containing sensor histidine kinase [Moraxellaceae bacterium]
MDVELKRALGLSLGAAALAALVSALMPWPQWMAVATSAAAAFGFPTWALLRYMNRHARALAAQPRVATQVDAFVQRLIDVIPQPVYIKDSESRYLAVNEAFCKERGRRAEELVGQVSWGLAKDPALADSIRAEDASVLAGNPVFKEESLPHMYSGQERFRLISKAACLDPEGRPVIVGANFDLTPWRQAERAVREALVREVDRRERFAEYVQRLIDVIPHPVYVKAPDNRYLMVNEAFVKDRGKPREALVGQPAGEPRDVEFRRVVSQEDVDVLAGKVVLKEEHRPHPYTGRERFRVVAKGSCLDPEGEPVIVCAIFDVTGWRQAERELKASLEREVERRTQVQQFIQRLIDVIPHPVYVKDADSNYAIVNDAYARDRGQSKEELIGQTSLSPRQDPGFNQTVRDEDEAVLAGKFVLKEEHRPHPFTGQDRYRVVAKGSCQDAEGRPVIVCAIVDVTGWRQAEARWMRAKEAAERANEAKSRFLANISHELRTPMHAVLSFARLGEGRTRDVEGSDKLHGYFARIVQSGENLLRLLNDLLDLSKLEAGRVDIKVQPFSLRNVLDEVIAEQAAVLDGRGLTVDIIEHEEPWVQGDPAMVAQVLRNLLSNAAKFSPERSSIGVAMAAGSLPPHTGHGPMVPAIELRVIDEGPGIPESELERVFEKFVQSSVTATQAGGTGLGLAICREIVQLHGGIIIARNRATGPGAEFVLRLPAATPEALAALREHH